MKAICPVFFFKHFLSGVVIQWRTWFTLCWQPGLLKQLSQDCEYFLFNSKESESRMICIISTWHFQIRLAGRGGLEVKIGDANNTALNITLFDINGAMVLYCHVSTAK